MAEVAKFVEIILHSCLDNQHGLIVAISLFYHDFGFVTGYQFVGSKVMSEPVSAFWCVNRRYRRPLEDALGLEQYPI